MTALETRPLNARLFKRETLEHYSEPFWCSARLFAEEKFESGIWNPCCGVGRIPDSAVRAGLYGVGTDIVDRGYRDFAGPCEWGKKNYVNPPFGSIIHQGKKKGPTAWVRKAIEEWQKGKFVILVYPIDKWVLMLLKAILGEHASVRNLGDVRWLATEDGSRGKGTGRHIACFILEPRK